MKRNAKRAALAVVASVAATASLTAITATAAQAISEVPCGPTDYLHVVLHDANATETAICFANGGEYTFRRDKWVTRIWTGNNRVQWHGHHVWEPQAPIEKWTIFTWPNHPGGVTLTAIRIV